MKKSFTFILFNVIIMALTCSSVVNAAYYKFATLADLKNANIAHNDTVTISGDVMVKLVVQSNGLICDASNESITYTIYHHKLNSDIYNWVNDNWGNLDLLMPGDKINGFSGIVKGTPIYNDDYDVIGYKDFYVSLFSEDSDPSMVNYLALKQTNAPDGYVLKTEEVTVANLVADLDAYKGSVISLKDVEVITKGFTNVLSQDGGSTTIKCQFYGVNASDIPAKVNITKAIIANNRIEIPTDGYEVAGLGYEDIKSLKVAYKGKTGANEVNVNLKALVLKREEIDGKLYFVIESGEGNAAVYHSATRVAIVNPDAAANVVAGDSILLTAKGALYTSYAESSNSYNASILSIEGDYTVEILNTGNKIRYFNVNIADVLGSPEQYEFLPVLIEETITFVSGATEEEQAHGVTKATASYVVDDVETKAQFLVDATLSPNKDKNVWVIRGIVDYPLWKSTSKTPVITPISAEGFISTVQEFESIAEMVEKGASLSSVISYELVNPVTITGIETIKPVGDEDQIQQIVFVADATGSLLLRGNVPYNVGDAIKSVSGRYADLIQSSILESGGINFGVANNIQLDATGVELVEGQAIKVEPIEVTIAQLIASDEYASKLVKLSNLKYKVIEEVVQDETVLHHYIYQGNDSIAVDASFGSQEDKTSIVGNYYLNGYYTRVIPFDATSKPVSVDNLATDVTLFMQNGVIYAQGAEVEVYDVMGRLVAFGVDVVSVENNNQNIFIVKTKYSDGQVFVSKIANR